MSAHHVGSRSEARKRTPGRLRAWAGLLAAGLFSALSVMAVAAEDPGYNLPSSEAMQNQAVPMEITVMEQLADAKELQAYLERQAGAKLLAFTEDRQLSIRRRDGLPRHWLRRTEAERGSFSGKARPGEYYLFQVGLYAVTGDIGPVAVAFGPLTNESGGTIAAERLSCLNLQGIDFRGEPLVRTVHVPEGRVQALWMGVDVPSGTRGDYRGIVTITAPGLAPVPVIVRLQVAGEPIEEHGDRDAWRLSRLRWLNLPMGGDESLPVPYAAVQADAGTVSCLGRSVRLGADGLPAQITSYFSPNNDQIGGDGRPLLDAPMRFVVETAAGPVGWTGRWQMRDRSDTRARWEAVNEAEGLTLTLHGTLHFDGYIAYQLELRSARAIAVEDIRLEIPMRRDAANYLMGMNHRGGASPDTWDWKWDPKKHQDCLWIGDVNAGLQFRLKDENFVRPLVNIYHSYRRVRVPESWANGDRGGCSVRTEGGTRIVRCFSGSRTLRPGGTLRFDFDFYLTPFKPVDLARHLSTRYHHSNRLGWDAETLLQNAGEGPAQVFNIHHANVLAPFINYPYAEESMGLLKQYVDAVHAKGRRAKVYYTTREITNNMRELWALHSLNGEVIFRGPGDKTKSVINPQGPHPWLREHMREDYLPAWRATLGGSYRGRLDLAVLTTPDSRWNNFYLAGLDYLTRHVGIDGVYIDDTALDRECLLRARRILARHRPNPEIDLHSWNHFNALAEYGICANIYMELFPLIDRIWFGEGHNYNARPDHWLIELSGIPFGLTGEMLQHGGNPWRGLLYGMTSRLGWQGDPRPVWRLIDAWGLQSSRFIGYWDPRCPVRTDHPDVLASVYRTRQGVVVAMASWATEPVKVHLQVDGKALNSNPERTQWHALASEDFQPEATFGPGQPIEIQPGRGWLLVAQPHR